MSELIHLVYASRATFPANRDATGIETNVARILAQSRKNNPKRKVGGVLYYGDDHFFQCLEGERETVERVYETIRKDQRHSDIRLLAEYPVEQRSFANWSMKYVAVERGVNDLLLRHGMTRFDPYRFDGQMVFDMMVLLKEAVEPAGMANMATHMPAAPAREADPPDRRMAASALVIAVLALLVATVALLVALGLLGGE